MRLLLLEDDRITSDSLVPGLRQRGFAVEHAADCGEALAHVARSRFDVAVLDLMVPGGSGYDVLRALRKVESGARVLILTARDQVEDRVAGLRYGADDYLVKPFALAELVARLHALLRRPARRFETTCVGALEIDPLHRRATVGDRRVDLTRMEFDLLLALIEQRGAVATRRHLLEVVWGYRFEPRTNVVEVHVARLRRKLEDAGSAALIRTIRGVGYVVEG